MDSLTHLAIGACMGEAFAGKKLGNRALVWGAVAQSIPDIDFLASFWMDVPGGLLAHRGFTHSILFVLLISLLFSVCAEKWHRPHNISFKFWLIFFLSVVGTHIILDAFNNYGVGWFEPFNHTRVTFNAIYVADPFFSVWPALGVLFIFYNRYSFKRNMMLAKVMLSIASCYLIYCLYNKSSVVNIVRKNIENQHIQYQSYMTSPAPLQNWLWYIVVKCATGSYIGFRSVLEQNDRIEFEYFPQNDTLLNALPDQDEIAKLKRFSQGYYTVEQWGDTLVFNDLRFGQMVGWENSHQKFVFHYYLKPGADNSLVVQRGRFKYWDIRVMKNFIHRIFTP